MIFVSRNVTGISKRRWRRRARWDTDNSSGRRLGSLYRFVDVVVTVPKALWEGWLIEGDAAGETPTGTEWGFHIGGWNKPKIAPGERVYVVAHGRLRGYAPLTRLVIQGPKISFCREGGAIAVTIAAPIKGFQGWRNRWWDRAIEVPFPAWKTEGVNGR